MFRFVLVLAVLLCAALLLVDAQCPNNCLDACGGRGAHCVQGRCLCYVSREAKDFLRLRQQKRAGGSRRQIGGGNRYGGMWEMWENNNNNMWEMWENNYNPWNNYGR